MLFFSTIFSLCILISIIYLVIFYQLTSLPIIFGAIIFGIVYTYLGYRILNKIYSKKGKIIFTLIFFIIQLVIGSFLIYMYHQPKDIALITNIRWNFMIQYLTHSSFIYAFFIIGNLIKQIKNLNSQ